MDPQRLGDFLRRNAVALGVQKDLCDPIVQTQAERCEVVTSLGLLGAEQRDEFFIDRRQLSEQRLKDVHPVMGERHHGSMVQDAKRDRDQLLR